jgi:hypothetical protein
VSDINVCYAAGISLPKKRRITAIAVSGKEKLNGRKYRNLNDQNKFECRFFNKK